MTFAASGGTQATNWYQSTVVSTHGFSAAVAPSLRLAGRDDADRTCVLPSFTGLLGCWDFDGDVLDQSGNSQHGALRGTARVDAAAGVRGGAVRFDGQGSSLASRGHVELPSINPRSAITVAAWVRSAQVNRYGGVWQMVSKYSAYILGTGGWDNATMCFIISSGGWVYGSCYATPDTTVWHHFVGTYDTATGLKHLYVDGTLRDTVSAGAGRLINADTGTIDLGHRECCDHGNFNGWLDEVRIYDRALSSAEITQLYQGTRP